MKRKIACLLVLVWLAACGRGDPRLTPTPGPATAGHPATLAASSLPPSPAFSTHPPQDMQSGRGSSATPSPGLSPTPAPDPLACLPAASTQEIAPVLWASTGDTIVVDLNGRQRSVRYLGVTAPAYLPNIRYIGPSAYLHNQQLVQGQIVELYQDGPDTDEQGQLLRYVVTHGLFVNWELARLGLVQAAPGSTDNPEPACAETLRQAERAAQTARLGLWGEPVIAAAPSANPPAYTPTRPPTAVAVAALSTATPLNLTPSPLPFEPSPTATSQPPTASSPVSTPTAGSPSATPLPGPTATSFIPIGPVPTNTPRPPTNTPIPPTNPPAGPTATTTQMDIIITDVNFEGDPAQNSADQYVEISNDGPTALNLLNWKLVSENTGATFTFPSFIIQPDVTCLVYTNMIDADSCVNNSFRSAQAIWSMDGDCAQLYDSTNHLQDEYCY